jgi:hypothetical protein
MPQARLISLVCKTTEDDTGPDEIYLLANGLKVWGQVMNDNDVADLTAVDAIDFKQRVRFDLYDEDVGGPDDDDHLGTFYARSGQAGRGELEYKFREDDADYTLTYEVLA